MSENDNNLIFLGIADYFEAKGHPFPVGTSDIFVLSQHKPHFIYPAIIKDNSWIFLIKSAFLKSIDLNKLYIRIEDEDNKELGNIHFSGYTISEKEPESPSGTKTVIFFIDESEYILFPFALDTPVLHPGKYKVNSDYDGTKKEIGSVHFHYSPTPPLTPDQIMAIESDHESARVIIMNWECKYCKDKISIYTALTKIPDIEKEGIVYQYDLPEDYRCKCGKTIMKLCFLRESMHGMLLKDFTSKNQSLNYVRRYGHQQILDIAHEFTKLIDKDYLEQPVQEFIEKHPIMLAKYSATRLFIKPNIIGKFQSDFAILDSRKHLLFIEIEKPNLPIFTKKGYPTSNLQHAINQVNDWLFEYTKYSGAIIESLGIKQADVIAIKGIVIAGRYKKEIKDPLQRFLSNPPYPNIEFITYDELSSSLITLSRALQ